MNIQLFASGNPITPLTYRIDGGSVIYNTAYGSFSEDFQNIANYNPDFSLSNDGFVLYKGNKLLADGSELLVGSGNPSRYTDGRVSLTTVLAGETYEHIYKDNNKVQVDSAIRDGNGKKIDTHYAKKTDIPIQYLKNATVNSTGDELTITKQDGTSVTFAGGGSTPENMVTTNTEQDLSAYKDFLEGLGISNTFKLKKLTGETAQTAVDCRTIDDGIYYLPRFTYFYINNNAVTTLGEGFVIIGTKTNGGTGKYWFYFGESNAQPTIMKGYLTSTGGSYSTIQTEGFVKNSSTMTQDISCNLSSNKSVINLIGHSVNGTYLNFTNFENGIGKTCSIGINGNFEPSFIDKDGNEKSFGGGVTLRRWS